MFALQCHNINKLKTLVTAIMSDCIMGKSILQHKTLLLQANKYCVCGHNVCSNTARGVMMLQPDDLDSGSQSSQVQCTSSRDTFKVNS